MSGIGVHGIDDTLTFSVLTLSPTTGGVADADAVPTYRVYEDEASTAIATGSMAKLDDANTTGFYTEQLTLSTANGYERGKSYTVYITASVSSTTVGTVRQFQVARTPADVFTQTTAIQAVTDNLPDSGALTSIAQASALTTVDTVADSIYSRLGAPSGSSIAADIANVSADNTARLIGTTIATITSQTQFTLTAGSSDDDAYNGMVFLPTDQVDSTQKSPRIIADYIGATKTVILRSAPVFTIAVGDSVSILVGSPPADVTALDEPTHLLEMPSRSDGVVRFRKRIRVAPGETVTFGPHFKRGQRVRPDSALQPAGLAGELSATLVGVAPEWVSYQLVVSDAATDGTTDYAVCEVTDKDGNVVQCVFTFDVKELHP